MSTQILLATRSAGKLRELRPMFSRAGFSAIDLTEAGIAETDDEEAIEVFETFEENARAKAGYFFRKSSLPTVADDSGLVVDALGGAPGVRSKRWSGAALSGVALDEANNAKLLALLATEPNRRARYVCVASYFDGNAFLDTRGETSGHIVLQREGSGGFGYDPYFFSDELGMTFGHANVEEKERISHRGRAFREMIRKLERRRSE